MENFERKERESDMELALFLIKHIQEPCKDLDGNNIRDFYVREAKKALDDFENPEAKRLLENILKRYSK
ncbi:MAG: hypothetical protein WC348_03535 [Patescibacteria group bacterium]|jgi:hypothetical protein